MPDPAPPLHTDTPPAGQVATGSRWAQGRAFLRRPLGTWAGLYVAALAILAALLVRHGLQRAAASGEPFDALRLLRHLGLGALALVPWAALPGELWFHRKRVAPAPAREAVGQAAFRVWLVNVFVATLVGSLWLFQLPPDHSPWVRLYVTVALVTSVALISLAPGVVFLAILRWVRNWRAVAWWIAFAGGLFLALVYTDTVVYRLLRYHFLSSAVVNVAFTPGSGDSIILGAYVWTTAGVIISTLAVAEFLLFSALARRITRLLEGGHAPHFLLQPRVVIVAGVLPSLLFSQSVYAAADISGDRDVLRATRPIPVVPRVRLGMMLDDEGERTPRFDILPDDSKLAWPAAAPELDPSRAASRTARGGMPNICIVVLDSWRRDMFDSELTPELERFSRDGARRFVDHLSGGNGTRYGLFTMLYGLHGSYWFPVLEERRSPVLIDTLQALGYDIRVFSSASMSFPEFRETAWVNLPPEAITDHFGDGLVSWQKDELLAEAFEGWHLQRERSSDERPFFSFLLIDAPHQPYANPGGPYAPAVEAFDYIEMGQTTDGPELPILQERVLNTYKNSVHHADGTAGRILDSLRRRGILDDTLVIVTGDHGEEFFECGFWGHTSAFSPEQVEVPFLMRGPGIAPGVEIRPTSHLDVSSSLLELLGAERARRGDYSLGESLFDPPQTRARVVAGWSDIGLWTESGIFDLPLRAPTLAGWGEEYECYDRHWNPVPDPEARFRREHGKLQTMADECVRFLTQAPR
ncbi:MAG: sulfatase-like hydrolase/transferase [Planctomycetota bacterium]